MKKYLPFILLCLVLLFVNDAYAQAAAAGGGSDEIFDKLAEKAFIVGSGLQEAGFIIAGLGMVVFTFMAIFNKLQWKHLAYIMFSTAVLSGMIALIAEVRQGSGSQNINPKSLQFNAQGYRGYNAGDAEGGSNARSVPVSR